MAETVTVVSDDSNDGDSTVAADIAVENAVDAAVTANEAEHSATDAADAAATAEYAAADSNAAASSAFSAADSASQAAATAERTLGEVYDAISAIPTLVASAMLESQKPEESVIVDAEPLHEEPPRRSTWLTRLFFGE